MAHLFKIKEVKILVIENSKVYLLKKTSSCTPPFKIENSNDFIYSKEVHGLLNVENGEVFSVTLDFPLKYSQFYLLN